MRNAFGSHPQWRENPYLHLLAGEMGNVVNAQRRREPNESLDKDSPSTKCQRPSREVAEREEIMKNSCPQDGNHNLAKGMKMWKGNGNTTTFPWKEILNQERREQVKTIVMEHFNGILFHKSGLANKQRTNHSSYVCILSFPKHK